MILQELTNFAVAQPYLFILVVGTFGAQIGMIIFGVIDLIKGQ